jgi:TolA-binding protein
MQLFLISSLLLKSVQAGELPPGVDPKEYEAFQEAAVRYQDRMTELQSDIRSYVSYVRKEEEAKIRDSYGAAYRRLQAEDDALRRVAIARMEAYLKKHDGAPDMPEVMYRLADLYLEDADISFQNAYAQYQQDTANLGPEDPEPPEPKKDYSRAIELYRGIIEGYPQAELLPNAYSNLAWCLGSATSAQFDEDAARDVNMAIVARFPNTVFSDDANMRLGEYFFEQVGTKDDPTAPVRTALSYYNTVMARGTESRYFEKAVYKIGWSYYKTNNYPQALAFLVKLLDYSQELYLKEGEHSDMRPEAVQYLAISYADIADREGKSPADVANEHLRALGAEREWAHDVVERLADTLLRQAKFEQAIAVYAYLQERWPLHPNNPIYQFKIAEIYNGSRQIAIMGVTGPEQVPGMPIRDPNAAKAAMGALAIRYSENTTWYTANKTNPDAIANAREFIEGSLADVAYLTLQNAKNPADYALAAQQLNEFLDQFPFSNKYDEYQWYYAYALFQSNQFQLAEVEFDRILKNARSQYRDGARYLQMKCREAVVAANFGDVWARPVDAIVERTVALPDGTNLNVYRLADEHTILIATYDDLIDRQFTDAEFAPKLETDKPAMAFGPGAILYKYGRNEEARARFEAFIKRYPKTDAALDALGFILETWKIEGNLEAAKADTERFLAMIEAQQIGKTPERIAQTRSELMGAAGGLEFAICAKRAEEAKYAEAGACYLGYMNKYPDSPVYADAMYNAANNIAKAGQAARANELYEQFINRFSSDPRSELLYFTIAANYSRLLELDKAIAYYDALATNFPNSINAPAAVYNASFLRVGQGKAAEAARGYERYATTYGQPDAEQIFWKAGEQWALVSDAQALDFYQRYLRRYPDTDLNHVIEAWYRTAVIYEKRRDTRRATAAREEIQNAFTRSGGQVSADARRYAAEGPVRDLMARIEAFRKVKFGTNEKANVELLTVTKKTDMRAIAELANQIVLRFNDFEANAAATYAKGLILTIYADMFFQVPIPPGLSEDETYAYQEFLDNNRIAIEDEARRILTANIALARERKQWCEWNSAAQALLHDRFPFDFAGERPETRGQFNQADVPMQGPSSIPMETTPAPPTPDPGNNPTP